ncbi:MAG: glycosyltransferase family 4 protein [Candidatus Polarisedimenticolia bacterium]
MKLLYFYRVPVPDPRADAVQVVQTCAGIARAGWNVTLHVETASAPLSEVLGFYGAEPPGDGPGRLELTAIGRRWSWPFLAWRIRDLWPQVRGTTACLFVREVRPYVPGLMARARRWGVPSIYEAHNVSARLVEEKRDQAASKPDAAGLRRLSRKALARARLEREILAAADGLICTQRATLDALATLIRPGTPSILLGNATRIPPWPASPHRDIDILYCGSLKPWKGVDTLVRALGMLAPHTLTIVGPGTPADTERLRGIAGKEGAGGRLRLLPPVSPAGVWDLYARARVGAIPLPGQAYVEARDFTSPLKLFEMLAAGLPVVASHLPALESYVADGREALLVPADDPGALASALRRVLQDDALRARLSEAGRARAAEFTWDARGRAIASFASRLGTRIT